MYYNINVNKNINFRLFLWACGNILFYDESHRLRFKSLSFCLGDCNNDILFGGASNSYLSTNRSRMSIGLRCDDGNIAVTNYSDSPISPNYYTDITNICDLDKCRFKFFPLLNSDFYNNVLSYIGKDVYFYIRAFGSSKYLRFLLKGGKPSVENPEKIDYFNHGDLYFCNVENDEHIILNSLLPLDSLDSNNNPVYSNYHVYYSDDIAFSDFDYFESSDFCGYGFKFDSCFDFKSKVLYSDFENLLLNKIDNLVRAIEKKQLSVVNEIIVDDNSNVNISKPNYHFEDSDNQGFWGM